MSYDDDEFSSNNKPHEHEYDSEYDSLSVASRGTASTAGKQYKEPKENQFVLPNVYTMVKHVNNRRLKIKLYETKQNVNARIINAVTGIPYYNDGDTKYKYTVGSRQEQDLFKVKMCAGIGQNRGVFFYDSPEQYERHQFTKVSETVKKTWVDKNHAYRKTIPRYNSQ